MLCLTLQFLSLTPDFLIKHSNSYLKHPNSCLKHRILYFKTGNGYLLPSHCYNKPGNSCFTHCFFSKKYQNCSVLHSNCCVKDRIFYQKNPISALQQWHCYIKHRILMVFWRNGYLPYWIGCFAYSRLHKSPQKKPPVQVALSFSRTLFFVKTISPFLPAQIPSGF